MNSQDRHHESTDSVSARARHLFDRASTRLDARTANALRLARREALAPARPVRRGVWIPAGAAMAAVLAIGLSWWLPQQASVAPGATGAIAQLPSANPEFAVDDDADLYAWLGDAPIAIDDTKGGAL